MLTVEPRAIRLGRVPRVVQVCVCGAILIRGVFRERVRYFWTYPDDRPRADAPRAFRSEDKAGVHCSAGAAFDRRIDYLAHTCPGITPDALRDHAWFVPKWGPEKGIEECSLCGKPRDELQHKTGVRERLGVQPEVQHGR